MKINILNKMTKYKFEVNTNDVGAGSSINELFERIKGELYGTGIKLDVNYIREYAEA